MTQCFKRLDENEIPQQVIRFENKRIQQNSNTQRYRLENQRTRVHCNGGPDKFYGNPDTNVEISPEEYQQRKKDVLTMLKNKQAI